MSGGLGRVIKHPDYYLSDGSVSFLTTGNTLFRVHKTFLARECELFRKLFESSAAEDPQAGSDAQPFTLDVSPNEFAEFLWVWYDRDYSYRNQTKERWVTILRLSTRWVFPNIKELAVREIDALGLPPAERIAIYNDYGIDDDRLLSSYVELCKSPTLPTEADGRLIQMETLINILQAREDAQRRAAQLGHESPTSASLEDETLREIVSNFFKKGLNTRFSGTTTGSEVQASSLNGERAQGIKASETITLGEPQVPDRKQSVNGVSSQQTSNSSQAGNRLTNMMQDKERVEAGNQEKVRQAKEKERAEKAKQEKEREEKEKQAKEERERVEKARQEKEREEKEKARQAKEEEKAGQRPAWRPKSQQNLHK